MPDAVAPPPQPDATPSGVRPDHLDQEGPKPGPSLPPWFSLDRTDAADVRGLVVLLHHWGGSRKSLARWRCLYVDLGFDVLSRDFGFHGSRRWQISVPIWPLWERECAELVGRGRAANRGPLLVGHGLSSLCSILLSFLSSSEGASRPLDAVVCENGPFLDPVRGLARSLRAHHGMPFSIVRGLLARLQTLLFRPGYRKGFAASLLSLSQRPPGGVPRMLFLISERDRIAVRDEISAVAGMFSNARSALLPGAGHLRGLKDCPGEYQSVLASFLSSR